MWIFVRFRWLLLCFHFILKANLYLHLFYQLNLRVSGRVMNRDTFFHAEIRLFVKRLHSQRKHRLRIRSGKCVDSSEGSLAVIASFTVNSYVLCAAWWVVPIIILGEETMTIQKFHSVLMSTAFLMEVNQVFVEPEGCQVLHWTVWRIRSGCFNPLMMGQYGPHAWCRRSEGIWYLVHHNHAALFINSP
jgi:hypothetical protein